MCIHLKTRSRISYTSLHNPRYCDLKDRSVMMDTTHTGPALGRHNGE